MFSQKWKILFLPIFLSFFLSCSSGYKDINVRFSNVLELERYKIEYDKRSDKYLFKFTFKLLRFLKENEMYYLAFQIRPEGAPNTEIERIDQNFLPYALSNKWEIGKLYDQTISIKREPGNYTFFVGVFGHTEKNGSNKWLKTLCKNKYKVEKLPYIRQVSDIFVYFNSCELNSKKY